MARPRNIKNEILRLREEGLTYNAIRKQLDCSKSTINYHCKRNDLTDIGYKNQVVDQDTIDKIREFCKTNKIKDAVKYFGLSLSTIKKYKKPPID